MKILRLRFKNLNSLAGEWSIDFQVSEYVSDGIFAISGPTGAGKSTIMDAICLALYGCTPRLKTISKSTNEIMSRQTGECFSEVVFETPEGRFRAYWSQRRARGKSEGALQNPEHELSDAGNGKVISSQLTTTSKEIENKTGMDYDRFVQSMMLAQGEFSKFLLASGNDRAPILEQITGTEIYSQISRHVFDRFKEEKIELERLNTEFGAIQIMSPEEEESVNSNLKEKEIIKTTLDNKVGELELFIKWIKGIDALQQELVKIKAEEIKLAEETEAFEPRKEKLMKSKMSLPLEGDYSSLMVIRNLQKEETIALNNLLKSIPDLEQEVHTQRDRYESVSENYSEAQNERETLLLITGQVKLMDQEINQISLSQKNIENQVNKLNLDKAGELKRITELKNEIVGFENEVTEITTYISDNKDDATLVTELTGIGENMKNLLEKNDAIQQAMHNLHSTSVLLKSGLNELEQLDRQMINEQEIHEKNIQNVNTTRTEADDLLGGRTLETIELRKDILELLILELNKVADLSEHRKQLEDGKPCPLCGSVHHPYAQGNIPQSGQFRVELDGLKDLLKKYAELKSQVGVLQEIAGKSAEKVLHINHKKELVEGQIQNQKEKSIDQNSELEKLRIQFEDTKVNLEKSLVLYGITHIPSDKQELSTLYKKLKNRQTGWQTKLDRKKAIEELVKEKETEIKVSEKLIETKTHDINARINDISASKTSLQQIIRKRNEIFGEKQVDVEESKALIRSKGAEQVKNDTLAKLNELMQKLEIGKNRINELTVSTGTRQEELNRKELNFKTLLHNAGFEDEIFFNSCRISSDERTRLELEDNSINTRRTQLETRKKEKELTLYEEESKVLTKEEPDVLLVSLEESKNQLNTVLQEIGALNQKLKANIDLKARSAGIREKINTQTEILNRWLRLNNLIGSADGKKYRNFAQGLTLGIMISHANSQLEKLSDRYLLTRSKNEPLEINVIDNYQAGEIRSTKNLSGGESFIVSLALALGLSRMSSRKVRVDSLFLDEGFGTLDEETLETALGTLAGLRHDGKMIGVISHVGALKERINTKITVQPIREGRSWMSGPGVRKQ